MRKILWLLSIVLLITSCNEDGKSSVVLPSSTGNTNKILVVAKGIDWDGEIGDEIRSVFGEHQVGLPQPETLLSASQVDPSGFKSFMRNGKAILIIRKGAKEGISVENNKYASPQVIVYASAPDNEAMVNLIKNRGKEMVKIFKEEDLKSIQAIFAKEKLPGDTFETVKNLGLELILPKRFKKVEDTGDFLWLRQRLRSGIARGDGTNNILIYSVPLDDEAKVQDNISAVRDKIGEMHIPGSKEGMYMITEKAYTPFTYEIDFKGRKAYETRGKWEVKNDFMAGPFLNYTIIDKENNRLIVFEGFTYAPSVSKRDFLFELEAIAKSMEIK